jgi:SAM-dependent methyltransferase
VSESATELNQRAFTDQATTFADGAANRVLTVESDWVFATFPRRADHVVLDVAAGTGLGARAVAADVKQVIAVDVTDAMLEVGRAEARAAGVQNILFIRADATDLPFLADSFPRVLFRYALHHFPDPARPLAEIRRVLSPGGWLGLADLVVSEVPAVAARANRIERLRDPSHARALSASALQDTLARGGFEVSGAETREIRRPLATWLAQTRTDAAAAAEIRAMFDADICDGLSTGLSPRLEPDGSYTFTHTLTSLLVLNPHG